MAGRVAEVLAVSALAAIVIVVIAAPVLRAPSERVFGMEIVGRQHDPFTVMEAFARPISVGVYSQPVTDIPGALLARVSGPVAAYNWLVLLSFPLATAAAYLLARYLALSRVGATVAALAYAFCPFHLAHAAYHPQVAETQWVPLYFLALWWCLDSGSLAAVAFLGVAALALTLSNFYGGLIAVAITPVAVAAYWFVPRPGQTRSIRRLGITAGVLAVIALIGTAYALYATRSIVFDRAAFAFPRTDLFLYSAKWWSYLVPPVEHPLFGAIARRVWNAAGVHEGLLEQQVYLGFGIVALGLIAIVRWLFPGRDIWRSVALARVPVLALVAATALLCSLSPERTIGAFTFVRPSAFLYDVLPMFRAYARFGIVVELMAALLAGVGVDYLRRTGARRAGIVCAVLVALVVVEYAVLPSALSRDVLPTMADRWVMRQPGRIAAFDCDPLTQESESVQWLTGHRVTLGNSTSDCTEPNLSQTLAASGYTHLLVRNDTAEGQWFAAHAALDGLRVAAKFDDGQVFAVTARTPAIYTAAMTGFFPREHNVDWSWRWMGDEAAWTVVNTRDRPIIATAGIQMASFQGVRRMELRLDGGPAQALVIDPARRVYQYGPITLRPGRHTLVFHPREAPTVANALVDNGDPRALSFAIGGWNWTVTGDEP